MPTSESLVKVRVELGRDEFPIEEHLWAKPLGDDLYEIRNAPFYAYGLHLLDVVRAVPKAVQGVPTVAKVIQRSGHKTLRVLFSEDVPEDEIERILRELSALNATYEHAAGGFYSIDTKFEADYQHICDYLRELEQNGILEYETGDGLVKLKAKGPTRPIVTAEELASGTLRAQLETCRRFKVRHFPAPYDIMAGISKNVQSGIVPLNGLRHAPVGYTTGWYIWAGEELSDAPDFFTSHHVSHLAEWRPEVLPYLGLPPGWRFLIAPGYEDVWYDPSLLDVS